jgi:hypothetical protein
VPKVSTGEKATVINGRWFHNNSTLKVRKGETGTNKIWDLTVNGLTGLSFNGIYNKKMSLLRTFANAFKHRKPPEVTLS